MKNASTLLRTLLGTGLILCSLNLASCKNETKPEDSKEAAEEQNEAKFEDTENKEDDSQYLVEAAETDLKEIEVGKLAQQKGTDPEVKAFGKMLVDDHTKSSGEVKTLAGRKNISLPLVVSEKGKEKYNELNEKSGLDFDKKFADMMVDGHKKALENAEKASEKAADEEIRVWAANKIPTLTAHLEHAEKLKKALDEKK